MKKVLVYLISIMLILAISCDRENKAIVELNKQIDELCETNNFSGAVLIAFQDSIYIDKAYGFKDKNSEIPNTTETIFPIASITKLFIKQSILSLVDQGKISLDDILSKYFDFVMHSEEIMISHLLYHQSGLPDIHNRILRYDNPWLLNYPIESDELLDSINSFQDLDFSPGSNTAYSNSNYLILARIIEKVSNQSLDVFLSENVFIPFHLNNTGLYKGHSFIDGHAEGFSTQHGEKIYTPDFNFYNFWGSGNAYSTTHDLYNYYKYSQEQLPANIKEQIIQHSGLYTGYRSYFKVVPEIGLVIIILSNNSDFQSDVIVDQALTYFENVLLVDNPKVNDMDYGGIYRMFMFQNEIKIEIEYRSGKYYYNGTELLSIKEDVFLIPKTGFAKITFVSEENNTYKMHLNDNGMLMTFSKII